MYSPLTRFFNPELAKKEKEAKEEQEVRAKKRSSALKELELNKGFQEFVIGYIKIRVAVLSDIGSMPDKGNLENEIFGRKQRLEELKELLNNISSTSQRD